MKKTSTFLYVLHIAFTVSFPKNETNKIPNIKRSTRSNYFSYFRNSDSCTLNATLQLDSAPCYTSQGLSVILNASILLYKSVYLKLLTFLQPIQVLCVIFFTRGRFLHSTFMSYKSMSTFHNPTSLLLNLI